MPPAPLPACEADRLAALRSFDVLDTESEAAFDELVALAARLTGSPVALVSLVDAERQWFKARYNLEATETPRDMAFCAHAILDPDQPLCVPDATKDPRFADNPLVTGAPNIRAYLGVPLVSADGHALGTLCVIDSQPHTYDEATIDTARTLARAVCANLELRRALGQVHAMALTDPLTGLPNRRALMHALSDLLASGEAVAVIAVDLDRFKETNDAEGHAAGDAVLKAVAQRLREAVRATDLVARVGGDEFIVVIPGMPDRDGATLIADRISAALHRPVPFAGRLLRLGATLGVAMAPADVAEPGMAMRAADEALMHCKRERRGGIRYASRDDATEMLRATDILRAFDTKQGAAQGTSVHLQPILRLDDAFPTGSHAIALEALARWNHPDLGMVPPQDLFRVIGPERSALVSAIARKKALTAFSRLRHRITGARLALNLSAAEVLQPKIAQRIAEQVQQAGLTLSGIELEITEEILLERVSDRVLDELALLRGRGARLVLDDFGTGNSGLAQLLRLPLDGLKLDKRFVQQLGDDVRAEEIVRTTVSLAHSLGLTVVAEGVETDRQLAMLRRLRCDAAQGYLFARPMAGHEVKAWLDGQASRDTPKLVNLWGRGSNRREQASGE